MTKKVIRRSADGHVLKAGMIVYVDSDNCTRLEVAPDKIQIEIRKYSQWDMERIQLVKVGKKWNWKHPFYPMFPKNVFVSETLAIKSRMLDIFHARTFEQIEMDKLMVRLSDKKGK